MGTCFQRTIEEMEVVGTKDTKDHEYDETHHKTDQAHDPIKLSEVHKHHVTIGGLTTNIGVVQCCPRRFFNCEREKRFQNA